jgi:tetratricopeptide (TPR) repeat protein
MIDNICETLRDLGERNAAISLLEALGRHATAYEQFDMLAMSYFKIKRFNESVHWAEQTLASSITNEQKYTSRLNLANAYAHAFYPEKALQEISVLESIAKNDIDVMSKKAYCLFLVGKLNEAEMLLKKILNDPRTDKKTKEQVEFNLGTYELYKDNFQEGLRKFLSFGRKMNLWSVPSLPFEKWTGKPIPNHKLVIRSEAGIGDEIINVRFMSHLKKQGIDAYWFTDRKDLKEIFNENNYQTIDNLHDIKPDNKLVYWCCSMDLPVLLNLEYNDLWNGPYLKSSNLPTPVKKTNKLKIGIRWQGNPDYENDLHRSIPLDEMWEVLKNIDADLYSLQRDSGADEVYKIPQIIPLHEKHLNTFGETLSIINDLDIIVTSCTSIAHAAAALGKKTFVFTPMSSYYVWCFSDKQQRSPWYGDNVKLLRQKRPRYWDEPLAELKTFLLNK